MNDNERIDWEELRIGYNRIYKTDYATPQQMVAGLYSQEWTLQKVGDILGISREAVGVYMQKHNLPRLPKGHRGNSLYQDIFGKIKHPEKYNYKELADLVGCSTSYIYNLKNQQRKGDH